MLMVSTCSTERRRAHLATSATHSKRCMEQGIEGGFHAFWCFRFAVVRRAGVPDNLIKVWKGHSQNLMELYSAQFRHDVAYNIVASARLKHSQFFETQLRACTVRAQIALRKKRKSCRGAATLMNQLLEEMVAGVRFEPTTFGL